MIGICIEAGITCPSCESYVPLNAMVPSVRCSACGKDLELSLEAWKTVLDDAIGEAAYMEEGEGRNSTVFGSYNYKILYGRLNPRFDDTKDDIDIDILLEKLDQGRIVHPESGAPTGVRRLPEHFAREFSGIIALVGEDPTQIPGTNAGTSLETGTPGPVAFQCPSCAGSLIVDGSERSVECSYCSGRVSLPDGLWFALHPVKAEKRWFLLFDEYSRPFEWEGDVLDALCDPDGNLYIITEERFGGNPLLVSTTPDRLPRWKTDELDIKATTDRGKPKLALTGDGRLLVACGDRPPLFILSATDGSILETVEPLPLSPEGVEIPLHLRFSMSGSCGFAVFPDDTLFLYRDCDRQDDIAYYYEFQRFDLRGNLLDLWKRPDEDTGFFQRLKRWFRSRLPASYVYRMRDYPVRTRDSDIRFTIDRDGSVYFLRHDRLLKFDQSGRKVYMVEFPRSYTTCRPTVNDSGEAFVLVRGDEDRNQVMRVSADGSHVSVAVASIVDGGPVENHSIVVLCPDGRLCLLGYSGEWILAEPELRSTDGGPSTQEEALQ